MCDNYLHDSDEPRTWYVIDNNTKHIHHHTACDVCQRSPFYTTSLGNNFVHAKYKERPSRKQQM